MEKHPQVLDDEFVKILFLTKALEIFKGIDQVVVSVLYQFTMKILFLKLFLLPFWGSGWGG